MCSPGSPPAGAACSWRRAEGPSQPGQCPYDRAQRGTQRPREGKGLSQATQGIKVKRSLSGGEQMMRKVAEGIPAGIKWSLAAFGCWSLSFPASLPRHFPILTPAAEVGGSVKVPAIVLPGRKSEALSPLAV